jgi:hypothetical protein
MCNHPIQMDGHWSFGLFSAWVVAEYEGLGLRRFKVHAKAGDQAAFRLRAELQSSFGPNFEFSYFGFFLRIFLFSGWTTCNLWAGLIKVLTRLFGWAKFHLLSVSS